MVTVTTRSDTRRTRDSFTRVLERVCQRLDEQKQFDVTHADLLGGKKQSQVEIGNVWVVGSYARGATLCGDLDLVVQMRATKGSLPTPRTVAAQAFGRLKDVSVYQGTPGENTSGIAFPEAVHVWSVEKSWRKALASIVEDPGASHFTRATDVLPLRPEQLSTLRETLEKLVVMKAEHVLDWRFMPYEATLELGALSHDEERVKRLTQLWGKHSRDVVPHVLKYLRTRHFICTRSTSDKAQLYCSGARILVGRPAVPYDDLDDLTCSRVVLAPHASRRGPNGLLEIRRGKRHPLEESAAPLSFFVLKESSGTLLFTVLEARFRSALMIELFQTEQAARKMAEDLGDTGLRVDVIGSTALLDFVSCADVLDLYEQGGSMTTFAMTHNGAGALKEQSGDDVTSDMKVSVARTEDVLRHLERAARNSVPPGRLSGGGSAGKHR
jgi:hypothetical protein